jgi:hypothetical protein
LKANAIEHVTDRTRPRPLCDLGIARVLVGFLRRSALFARKRPPEPRGAVMQVLAQGLL